jgi:hypothetical protein
MSEVLMCTVVRLYEDYPAASRAIRELQAVGVRRTAISIVAGNAASWYEGDGAYAGDNTSQATDRKDDAGEGALLGSAVGATVGSGLGLLAGLGVIAIPGLGPVVAAGWLATTAAGALAGAAAGGIVGALIKAGVSKKDAPVYAEGIRRGGAVVSAFVPEADRRRTEEIMDRGAVDIEARRAEYEKSGWKGFDVAAPVFTREQIRTERTLHP